MPSYENTRVTSETGDVYYAHPSESQSKTTDIVKKPTITNPHGHPVPVPDFLDLNFSELTNSGYLTVVI